jgi:nucleoside-diphosphate kinase
MNKIMAVNRSFFLLKPDGVSKELLPEIILIFENKGIIIDKIIYLSPDVNHWKQHYIEHRDKSFYDELCTEMADKSVIAMRISTQSLSPCWKVCREILGTTDPKKASENTIRGKYGTTIRQNVAHASDSVESSERELQLWKLA